MISLKEILMGRAEFSNLPKDVQNNLMDLLERINKVRQAYNLPMKITSGLRLPQQNSSLKNSSQNSWHLKGAAVDIADADAKLWHWLTKNLELLQKIGLWIEDKRWTPTWVHLQIFPPKSGKRIFIPSNSAAIKPELWDGKYDNKYDKL